MRNLLLLSCMLVLLNVNAAYVQGTIYDENGVPLPGVSVWENGTLNRTKSDVNGFYSLETTSIEAVLDFLHPDYVEVRKRVGVKKVLDVHMERKPITVEGEVMDEIAVDHKSEFRSVGAAKRSLGAVNRALAVPQNSWGWVGDSYHNTEEYATIHENGFRKVLDKPLSTFSIDVDAASYSNMRRFINNGQLPPKDAVRVEEMINYFNYSYKNPVGNDPFSIETEVAKAPWNEEHLIVHLGLQGRKIAMDDLPASNIVFLLDVSGSMSAHNKLPLLKSAFKLLANELRPQDKVSIVVYAGAAGLVLPPTDGNDKGKIMKALDNLQAGGSTAGGAGIKLAYQIAKENYVDGGNNRVVLATDGDFNVGVSSNAGMERLIEEKRNEGVFLTVLGFGMGNYKDSKMETLADKGNGNYAYIDTMKEAKKVLVNEFGGTMFTIAKDVKIQVEFNPAQVQSYRLIGYENRKLNDEDFNDDKKDAGELGSGHTVTALYEIIPAGVKSEFVKTIDPLKYQANGPKTLVNSDELLTVKFRYKEPEGQQSKLISKVVEYTVADPGENLTWSMAVAGFGMLLRDSQYKGDMTYPSVLALAKKARGTDEFGYRSEFIELVEIAKGMRSRQ